MAEFVVAGNKDEYQRWLTQNKRGAEHKGYVVRVAQLLDAKDLTVHLVGTWHSRTDINSIMNEINRARGRGKVLIV